VRERVSIFLCPARHIIGYFRYESFQAITCTGTDNSKQTTENTPKTQDKHKIQKLALGKKNHTNHTKTLN